SQPGVDGAIRRLLQVDQHVAAAYFEISKSARAKFAQCILRRVASKPDRTDKPLRVWRTCCNRCGDNYHRRPRDGNGRMDIGMARKTANGFGARVAIALAFGLVLN